MGCVDGLLSCRFIKNNLLVELSSMRLSAKLFSWVLRRHTMVAYTLYMAGALRRVCMRACLLGAHACPWKG